MDYKLIRERSTGALENAVKAALDDGFALYGTPYACYEGDGYYTHYQAMVNIAGSDRSIA